MKFEDTEMQVQFGMSLNAGMARHYVDHPNFKGFMADSTIANWNAVHIVYGIGSTNDKMEIHEWTCLLHWSTSLQKYIWKHIKEAFQQQYNTLCKQYKNAKTMEEAKTHYVAIQSWWLSSRAANEDALHHFKHWLAFWHFWYWQWRGFMQIVSACSL